MQLSYRGVKYNTSEPTVEIVESSEVGQYRGAVYHLHRAVNNVARSVSARSTDVLKYRGAIVR